MAVAGASEGTARAVLQNLGPAQSRDEALKYGQLHATLAVLETLQKCEEHLFNLTAGRSA